jgi:hypothetical protein
VKQNVNINFAGYNEFVGTVPLGNKPNPENDNATDNYITGYANDNSMNA